MTQYLEDTNVYHPLRYIDHKSGEAISKCGKKGEPVEADPDDDLCGRCWQATRDDEEKDEAELVPFEDYAAMRLPDKVRQADE